MHDSVADDPNLALLWDTPQNPEAAAKVPAHSYRPAAWRCVRGHAFARSPRAMQKDASCPTCSKGANTHTNLAKLRPGVASQWDADKNPNISFATLDATHASIDVGRMAHVPIGSSVLQRRRGYKDILRHHLALRAAARIPFDKNAIEKGLLGVKDVATLYELWCYFAVVDAVREVIGREPDVVDDMDVKIDEVDLGRGFCVAWIGGPTVHYNLSFSKGKPSPRRSASLLLRPDIVIEIDRDGQLELHVFDAKLRVDGVTSVDDENEDDEADPLTFKKDDVAKMHAYRDALPHVRSARVLYPGNVARDFPALEPGARPTDAVGAIPLNPGCPAVELLATLRTIIPASQRCYLPTWPRR